MQPIGRHEIALCPITNDIHFDQLIQLVSTRLLHFKLLFSPCNEKTWENLSIQMKIMDNSLNKPYKFKF